MGCDSSKEERAADHAGPQPGGPKDSRVQKYKNTVLPKQGDDLDFSVETTESSHDRSGYGLAYVTPLPAYPGQEMPPPFLFTPINLGGGGGGGGTAMGDDIELGGSSASSASSAGSSAASSASSASSSASSADSSASSAASSASSAAGKKKAKGKKKGGSGGGLSVPDFHYGVPAGYVPPPYSEVVPKGDGGGGLPPVPSAANSSSATSADGDPRGPPPSYADFVADKPKYKEDPPQEQTVAFPDDDYITTNVPYEGDPDLVTHINLFHNNVTRIEGLANYNNLIRLTLRSNNLTDMTGLADAPFLRWLDLSENDLVDLRGLDNVMALEWLDVSSNNLESFSGFARSYRLTWVNAYNNNLVDLSGMGEQMPYLKKINLENNDLRTTAGLEGCTRLIEANLKSNDIDQPGPIKALASLPQFYSVDIRDNNLSLKQRKAILAEFKKLKPKCVVKARV